MNCPACQQPNPDDAQFCGDCGVRLTEHTADRAEIAELVNRPPAPDATPPRSPVTPAPPSTPAAASTPTEAFDASLPPSPVAPPATHTPTETFATHPGPAITPGEPLLVAPQRKSSIFPIVVAVAAIASVVLVGALLILSDDSDDSLESTDSAPASSIDPAPTTGDTAAPETTTATDTTATPATSTAPETTAPDSGPTTIETATETTSPETTSPETTTPATTSVTTTAPDPDSPAAVPPVPAEPGPLDAAGSPQVLANVLPSGVAYTEVAASFTTAQALGDALALEDWEQARTLLPSLAGESDASFAIGYGGTNRISLMLIDARQEPGTDQLLVASVAVELDGAQTSIFCLRWDVSTGPGTISQVSGARLARLSGNVQPEAIRNDPDAMATIAECTWE